MNGEACDAGTNPEAFKETQKRSLPHSPWFPQKRSHKLMVGVACHSSAVQSLISRSADGEPAGRLYGLGGSHY